jgi:hypothetical protein
LVVPEFAGSHRVSPGFAVDQPGGAGFSERGDARSLLDPVVRGFDGVFAIRNARVVGDKHLKMWVSTADQSRSFDAIAFNFKASDGTCALPEGEVRLVYRLDINDYKGERRLQLLVDHVLP